MKNIIERITEQLAKLNDSDLKKLEQELSNKNKDGLVTKIAKKVILSHKDTDFPMDCHKRLREGYFVSCHKSLSMGGHC